MLKFDTNVPYLRGNCVAPDRPATLVVKGTEAVSDMWMVDAKQQPCLMLQFLPRAELRGVLALEHHPTNTAGFKLSFFQPEKIDQLSRLNVGR
jgi:hypothetical protein